VNDRPTENLKRSFFRNNTDNLKSRFSSSSQQKQVLLLRISLKSDVRL